MYKRPKPIIKPCRADDEDDCPPKLKYDIECEAFFDLMQAYRCVPFQNQDAVCKYYSDVKVYISRFVEKQVKKAKAKHWRDTIMQLGKAGQPLPDDHPLLQGEMQRKDGEDLPAKE